MKISRLILPTLCLLGAASGAAYAQNDLKPGLWETRIIQMNVDGKDMMAQMNAAQEQMRQALAKMPAEQRKRMEGMFSGMGMGMGGTQRICITPEMAARDNAMVPQDKRAQCEAPKVKKLGDGHNFEVACKRDNGDRIVSKGQVRFAGDLVKTNMEAVATKAGGARNTTVMATEMKFVGSNCGSVQPVDEIVRGITSQAGAMPGAVPGR